MVNFAVVMKNPLKIALWLVAAGVAMGAFGRSPFWMKASAAVCMAGMAIIAVLAFLWVIKPK